MRLLYLHSELRSSGRSAIRGRRLLERLRARADEFLVAYAVWGADEDDQSVLDQYPDEVLSESAFRDWRPTVVVLEGGLFEPGDGIHWRVPHGVLHGFCRAGGILVITDVDAPTLRAQRHAYQHVENGKLIAFPFADHVSWISGFRSPVYALDLEHGLGSDHVIACRPDLMFVEEWLRPALQGLDMIVADHPAELLSCPGLTDCAASGNQPTTRVLVDDLPVPAPLGNRPEFCPFATVRAIGDGFSVFIAAGITHDRLLDLGGNNDQWIDNLIELLAGNAKIEEELRAPLRALQVATKAGQDAATYLDGNAAGQVLARTIEEDFDRAAKTLEQSAAQSHASELRASFGDERWDRLCERSRAALVTAEVVQGDLAQHAELYENLDFAPVVHLLSRALEAELADKLFLPLRELSITLPSPSEDSDLNRSLRDLGRFITNPGVKPPTLDAMARILRNVGDKLRDAPDNGFAVYLDGRLTGASAFCRDYPRRLNSYVDRFRNAAAHIEAVSQDDVKAARAFLLEEPAELLLWLSKSMR